MNFFKKAGSLLDSAINMGIEIIEKNKKEIEDRRLELEDFKNKELLTLLKDKHKSYKNKTKFDCKWATEILLTQRNYTKEKIKDKLEIK